MNYGDLTPLDLFADITSMPIEHVAPITQHCLKHGYIPFIDYSPEMKAWVFHTLLTPDGLKSQKKIAKRFEVVTPNTREKEVEKAVVERLKLLGENVRSQFNCGIGRADIVTNNAVYEVENILTRARFYEALGQVLLYRQAINPELRAVIVGYATSDTAAFIPFAEQLGVEVWIWME